MDLEAVLSLLGLEGKRFALATRAPDAPPGQRPEFHPSCHDTVDAAERWLEAEPDGWNVYITLNAVKPGVTGKPKRDDIAFTAWQLVDVDPAKTREDPHGTSQAGQDAAADAADAAFEALGRRAVLVSSGRGAQLWVRVCPTLGSPERRALEKWLTRQVLKPELAGVVDVDATHNADRLARLPGYANSRTGREAFVIDTGYDSVVSRDDLYEWGLLDESGSLVEIDEADLPPADTSPPSDADVAKWVKGRLRDLWRETEVSNRSKRDFEFLAGLLEARCPEATASRLLYALPGGKWKADGRGDDYWTATLASVYKHRAAIEARETLINGLPGACDDPLHVFSEPVLDALWHLQRDDMARWVKLRSVLVPLAREAKWRISDLEKQVAAHGRLLFEREGLDPPDDMVRCLVGVREDGHEAINAWIVPRSGDAAGTWTFVDRNTARSELKALGHDPDLLLLVARQQPWRLVPRPFQPSREREWNPSVARLLVTPKKGEHPTWDQVLRVTGRGLDDDLAASEWAQEHGLTSGQKYLERWLSRIVQAPHERLPYLACVSPKENIGKSFFHVSVSSCLFSGVVDVGQAMLSEGGFNEELLGAVLCVVDDTNLNEKRGLANLRLKRWSTGKTLAIHPKGGKVFTVENYTHWYQCCNKARYVPIFSGDSRITMWEAMPAEKDEKASTKELLRRCAQEAPAFLYTLLSLPEVTGDGRHSMVPIKTDLGTYQAKSSRSALEVWRDENPKWIAMDDKTLISAFRYSLHGEEQRYWSPSRILQEIAEDDRKTRLVALGLKAMKPGRYTTPQIRAALGLTMSDISLGRTIGSVASVLGWPVESRTATERGWDLVEGGPK